jgi:hypothetical protein
MVMSRDELRDELRGLAYEVVETLLAKREDYGTQNIAITGGYGLAVRLQDKVSRLLNLEGGETPNFESLDDTYRDIIGYAMIGLVPQGWGLSRGKWEITEMVTEVEVVEVTEWETHIKLGGTDD